MLEAGMMHVGGHAPLRPGKVAACEVGVVSARRLVASDDGGAGGGEDGAEAKAAERRTGRVLEKASLLCSGVLLSVAIAMLGTVSASSHAEAPCDLLAACERPASCPALFEPPPDVFSVRFETTAGQFTITAVTEWAPPYAQRFWQLARTEYMRGAPFYRVDRINSSVAWVVQFRYRGEPTVDKCWDDKMTSNATWSVHKPGNVRGTVAFSMNAVVPTPEMINCTSELYCAQGFSTNIFINYANNTRLDSPGFSIFGYVEPGGMEVVDRLFAGYGEVSDLCGSNSTQKSAAGTSFCNGFGKDCKGVSMSRLLDQGRSYWRTERPLLDSILSTQLVPTERGQPSGWLGYDDGEEAVRREHRARRGAGDRELLRLRSSILPWNQRHDADDDSPILVTVE